MSVEIMKNLYKMQQNGDGTDCCFAFEVQSEDSTKEPETRVINAHKTVLFAASPVFKAMFSEKWSKDDKIVIKEASFEVFDALIKAIYTGCFEINNLKDMLEVLSLAHMYQIDSVIEHGTNYVVELWDFYDDLIKVLNHACLHKNIKLTKAMHYSIQSGTTELLKDDSFLEASPEVVNLIFSFDQLTIESETELMEALEGYLEAHPEKRSEVQDAIHSIRFLTIEEVDIKKCSFIDDETKNHLIKIKSNFELSKFDLSKFSKKRTPRSRYKYLSSLPSNVVVKLYEVFNSNLCYLCDANHNTFKCPKDQKIYKPFSYLHHFISKYNSNNLERYSNDDIISILKTLARVAMNEKSNKYFSDFLLGC